jgi:hypothetical protein
MGELIKVSCKMADTAGFAAYPGCDVTPFPDLLNELPDRERGQFQTGLETLASEIGCKIHSLE